MSTLEYPGGERVAALACRGCGAVYYSTDSDESACPECDCEPPVVLSWDVWASPERLCGSVVEVRYRALGRGGERAGGTPVTRRVVVDAAWATHFVGTTEAEAEERQLLVFNGDQPLVLEFVTGTRGVAVRGMRVNLAVVEERSRQTAINDGWDGDDDDEGRAGFSITTLRGP